MTENQGNPTPDPKNQASQETWREVGRQFQALGDSLANAFRAAWEDEANRQKIEEMRSGVESMVKDVGQALHEYTESPQGQQVKSDVKRAAQDLRSAGETTMSEARPHLVSALKQVNLELQRMIDRMDHPTDGPESR